MASSAKETVSEPRCQERRNSYRVRPSPNEPIRGTLGLGGAGVAVTVRDLSLDGIALVASGKVRPVQPAGTDVELALHLPRGSGRFNLRARLVRIESSSRHTVYALHFAARHATAFTALEQNLHAYVMRRQLDTVVVTRAASNRGAATRSR